MPQLGPLKFDVGERNPELVLLNAAVRALLYKAEFESDAELAKQLQNYRYWLNGEKNG